MIRRAWLAIAGTWAVFVFSMLLIGSTPSNENLTAGPMLIAFGPLALPWILGAFGRFVVTGDPRKKRGIRVMTGRP